MPARRRIEEPDERPRKPATTPEAREYELINLAQDLAEKQLRDGTASSQVISLYSKAGSLREQLEQERLRHENELTKVKIEAIKAQERTEAMYKDALAAMKSYSGQPPDLEDEDED